MDHQSTQLTLFNTIFTLTGVTVTITDKCMLMALPAELRVMIFALLIVSQSPIELIPGFDMSPVIALTQVNKVIHNEVIELFFGKNTFHIKDFETSGFFLPTLPTRFTSKIQWLQIDWAGSLTETYSHVPFGGTLSVVKVMKRLKGCTIKINQRVDWKGLVAHPEWKRELSYHQGVHATFLHILRMSKTCKLSVHTLGDSGDFEEVDENAMVVIRKAHQCFGMDWSWFFKISNRRSEMR